MNKIIITERQLEVRDIIDTYRTRIKGINESHTAELKELNNYTRERDLDTQDMGEHTKNLP